MIPITIMAMVLHIREKLEVRLPNTDRDVAAAQVVAIRGLAALGYTVKMLVVGGAFPQGR